MKLIPLSQNKFSMVDDADFEEVSKYKWYARKDKNTYYARRNHRENGKHITICLHRFLLKADETQEVDHKDRNGLNNQRSNIKICSRSENMINRIFKNSTGYRGVFLIKKTGRFTGAIQVNKKRIRIGCFASKQDAAIAYNEKAKQLHGELAILNKI